MCMLGILTGSFDDNAFTARLNLGRTPSFNVFFVSSEKENLLYIYIYKHIIYFSKTDFLANTKLGFQI